MTFSISLSYVFRSYGYTPIRFRVSVMRVVLIFLSSELELLRLGEILISSKCGLNLLSSKISKP